jgi:hypothetical protein
MKNYQNIDFGILNRRAGRIVAAANALAAILAVIGRISSGV